jgi:hypothetical protein
VNRHDNYSLVALGNIYYQAKFEKKEKEERYLKLALEFYWKVLQRDPKYGCSYVVLRPVSFHVVSAAGS